MKRYALVLLFAVAVITVSFAGCLDPEEEEGDITYIDQVGNVVTLSGTPEKIVSLAPSITEILFELGIGDRVVGRDDSSDYPAATADIEIVTSFLDLDLEVVIYADPDIVLMDKTLDMSGNWYDALKGAEIPVYQVFPQSLDEVLEQITLIGEVCGVEDKATEVTDGLKDRIDAITNVTDGIDDGDKPDVLFVIYYGIGSDPWVGTDHTFSGDLIAKAGGNNIISDDGGIGIQVSLEVVILEDPDIIFTSQSAAWPTESRQQILDDEALEDVAAVKNGAVYDVNGDLTDRTGPRLVDGLELLYDYISQVGANA